jgi:hypothetical protein
VGGCWWAAAGGRLLWAAAGVRLLGRLLVGGCWWAAAVGGCWGGGGQETPEVPVLPVLPVLPGWSKKALYSEKPEN